MKRIILLISAAVLIAIAIGAIWISAITSITAYTIVERPNNNGYDLVIDRRYQKTIKTLPDSQFTSIHTHGTLIEKSNGNMYIANNPGELPARRIGKSFSFEVDMSSVGEENRIVEWTPPAPYQHDRTCNKYTWYWGTKNIEDGMPQCATSY